MAAEDRLATGDHDPVGGDDLASDPDRLLEVSAPHGRARWIAARCRR
jgi:hypothetical protein